MPNSTRQPPACVGLVRLSVVLLVHASALSGCLTRKPESDAIAGAVGSTYVIPLMVESRFREDLTLFVVHDGLASRIGRIGSSSTTRIVIPKHMVGATGELSLLLEPLGSRSGVADRVQSQRMRVLPGQGLVWTLETDLRRSFLQVVPAALAEQDTIKR
jgi:hypothetical protein